jgi:hypothetical protein
MEEYKREYWLEQSEINFPNLEPKRKYVKVEGKLLISDQTAFRWKEDDKLGEYVNVLHRAKWNNKECFLKRTVYKSPIQIDVCYFERIISVNDAHHIMKTKTPV